MGRSSEFQNQLSTVKETAPIYTKELKIKWVLKVCIHYLQPLLFRLNDLGHKLDSCLPSGLQSIPSGSDPGEKGKENENLITCHLKQALCSRNGWQQILWFWKNGNKTIYGHSNYCLSCINTNWHKNHETTYIIPGSLSTSFIQPYSKMAQLNKTATTT